MMGQCKRVVAKNPVVIYQESDSKTGISCTASSKEGKARIAGIQDDTPEAAEAVLRRLELLRDNFRPFTIGP